jgi:hypothetical protein
MNSKEKDLSRRTFLVHSTLAAAGLALGHTLAHEHALAGIERNVGDAPARASSKSRAKVVLIRDRSVIKASGVVDAAIAARMIDEAVTELLGTKTADEAWKQLFRPTDRPGIKTNIYNYLPTPPDLNDLLQKRISACGPYDTPVPVTDREARTLLANRSALLNIRPVRTHHWSGIGSCLKNYIMFAETPSDYHADSCADLGSIWNLPIVKGKTRLNILLAINPLFYGRGPHNFDPRYQWNYCGIFVSRDPVAVDALGAELLRLKRISFFGEDKAVTPTKHIEVAELKHGLGVSDIGRIDVVHLGWKEEMLLG